MKAGVHMTIELGTFIGLMGVLAGILFSYISFQRAGRKEVKEDTKEDTKSHTELKTKLDYIGRGIDEIRIDMKAQENRVTDLAGAVIRVEEIAKSAHKRIDTMEERK